MTFSHKIANIINYKCAKNSIYFQPKLVKIRKIGGQVVTFYQFWHPYIFIYAISDEICFMKLVNLSYKHKQTKIMQKYNIQHDI